MTTPEETQALAAAVVAVLAVLVAVPVLALWVEHRTAP